MEEEYHDQQRSEVVESDELEETQQEVEDVDMEEQQNDSDEHNVPAATNNSHDPHHHPQQQQQEQHHERRTSIQHIMKHPHLSQQQKNHSIQILMDGRRRSSFGSTFFEAALNVAAEFASMGNGGGGGEGIGGEGGGTGVEVGGQNNGSNSTISRRRSRCSMSIAGSSGNNSCHSKDDQDDDYYYDNNHNNNGNNRYDTHIGDSKPRAKRKTGGGERYLSSSSSSYIHHCSNQMQHQQQQQQHPPTIAYTFQGIPAGDTRLMISKQKPCTHYKRNCSIISPCCGMVYGCRLCHDECEDQYTPFMRMLHDGMEREEQRESKGSYDNIQSSNIQLLQEQKQKQEQQQTKKLNSLKNGTSSQEKEDIYMQEETIYNNSVQISQNTQSMNAQQLQHPYQEQPHPQQREFQMHSSQSSSNPTSNTFQMSTATTMVPSTSATNATTTDNISNDNNANNNNTNKSLRKSLSKRLSLSSIHSESGGGDDFHHDIDRFALEEIICQVCFKRQPCKTNICIQCGIKFGEYHCSICNLWMEDKDGVYHCDECGICRIGGRENFKHCETCGMCIDVEVFDDHKCQAGKFMSKCPVCFEDLFTSRNACHELPCCHSLHWDCFRDLSKVDIRCPICKKTMFPDEDIEEMWSGLREDIAIQPLPPSETRVVDLVCNDCEKKDSNRRWHPLGVECLHCNSFNTSIDIKMSGMEAFYFLKRREEQ